MSVCPGTSDLLVYTFRIAVANPVPPSVTRAMKVHPPLYHVILHVMALPLFNVQIKLYNVVSCLPVLFHSKVCHNPEARCSLSKQHLL